MGVVYNKLLEFKRKYPSTVAWRLKSHSKVIEKHINDDEKVLYVFTGQYNDAWYNFFTTGVFVITDRRLMVATKRLFIGYFFHSITPDMFNDLKITSGIFWGTIEIDTIKEYLTISDVSKKALDEIETNITEHIMKKKEKMLFRNKNVKG